MAAHVSNFKQTDEKIVLDLINEQNGTTLPDSAITFGDPEEVVAGQIATSLEVTAAQGSGYRGSVELAYNRVPLSFMNTNEPDLVLEVDDEATTTLDLIDALNTAFGIQLTQDSLVSAPLPVVEADEQVGVELEAAALSLVWHGKVTIQLTAALVDLATVLTTTTLDGLYPPEPVV